MSLVPCDPLYSLAWTENHSTPEFPVGDKNYSIIASKDEVVQVLKYLKSKGDVFTDLEIKKYDPNRSKIRAADGHFHIMNGKPEVHHWEDCPEYKFQQEAKRRYEERLELQAREIIEDWGHPF